MYIYFGHLHIGRKPILTKYTLRSAVRFLLEAFAFLLEISAKGEESCKKPFPLSELNLLVDIRCNRVSNRVA